MGEEDDGTTSVLSGGRASGSGIYPKAFEQNAGTADFTNLIVELVVSRDKDTGALTLSFDGRGPRVVANDLKIIPDSGLSYAGSTLTLKRNTLQRDIKGKVVAIAADTDLTATIVSAGGGMDLKNDGVTEVTAATFLNITPEANDVLFFTISGAGGDLSLATGSDRMGIFFDAGTNKYALDWVRGHP